MDWGVREKELRVRERRRHAGGGGGSERDVSW